MLLLQETPSGKGFPVVNGVHKVRRLPCLMHAVTFDPQPLRYAVRGRGFVMGVTCPSCPARRSPPGPRAACRPWRSCWGNRPRCVRCARPGRHDAPRGCVVPPVQGAGDVAPEKAGFRRLPCCLPACRLPGCAAGGCRLRYDGAGHAGPCHGDGPAGWRVRLRPGWLRPGRCPLAPDRPQPCPGGLRPVCRRGGPSHGDGCPAACRPVRHDAGRANYQDRKSVV